MLQSFKSKLNQSLSPIVNGRKSSVHSNADPQVKVEQDKSLEREMRRKKIADTPLPQKSLNPNPSENPPTIEYLNLNENEHEDEDSNDDYSSEQMRQKQDIYKVETYSESDAQVYNDGYDEKIYDGNIQHYNITEEAKEEEIEPQFDYSEKFPEGLFPYSMRMICEKGKKNYSYYASDKFMGDWNGRFQLARSKTEQYIILGDKEDPNSSVFPKIYLETTRNSVVSAHYDLINLADDFLYSARTYGKIIISEFFLPIGKKTIKPNLSMGGLAGGEKYLVHNILFKFALNTSNLFDSDYAAAKVAGHELKGVTAYYNFSSDYVTPLMCVVDYLGYRLLATSVLPVDKTTLVTGSQDGGMTVMSTDDKLNGILKQSASVLNLKPHLCGRFTENSTMMYTACDTEGHLGHDGRYYLLDFSRTFPPEAPMYEENRYHKGGHLYRLFRPEFVKSYSIPLCNDAFSGFVKVDPNKSQYNKEIIEATEYLYNVTIPKCAEVLTEEVLLKLRTGTVIDIKITDIIHSMGVNLRHMGRIKQHVKKRIVLVLLLLEMTERTIKNIIREKHRKQAKELRIPLEEPFRRTVINVLNLVYASDSKESEEFWKVPLKKKILEYFPKAFTDEELDPSYPLKNVIMNYNFRDYDTIAEETQVSQVFSEIQMLVWIRGPNLVNSFNTVFLFVVTELLKNSTVTLTRQYTVDLKNGRGSVLRETSRVKPDIIINVSHTDLLFAVSTPEGIDNLYNKQKIKVKSETIPSSFAKELLCKLFKLLKNSPCNYCEDAIVCDGKYVLLRGLIQKLDMKFNTNVTKIENYFKSTLKFRLESDVPFVAMDLIELGARVKFMNVIESAQGLIYRELAVYYAARSSVISSMYFTKSIEKLNASLTRNPTKVENLLLISEALWRSCEPLLEIETNESAVSRRLSVGILHLLNAVKILQGSNVKDRKVIGLLSIVYYRLAQMFFVNMDYENSEEYFLLALEADPNNIDCNRSYAHFLANLNKLRESEKFYGRSRYLLEYLQNK